MSKDEPLIQDIFQLFQENDFKGILTKIRHTFQSCDKDLLSIFHLLSWPAPTESDLELFSKHIYEHRVLHVYSIGCGTGLLEWLLLQAIRNSPLRRASKDNPGPEVEITGIEIDYGWWSSSYAPPMFLPLVFIDKDFDCEEPFGNSGDMALFCYFNNLKVFLDYLAIFRGKFVAILGPISNTQFCAPGPLELAENPEMPCALWKIISFTPFGLGNVDHLAIYQKVD